MPGELESQCVLWEAALTPGWRQQVRPAGFVGGLGTSCFQHRDGPDQHKYITLLAKLLPSRTDLTLLVKSQHLALQVLPFLYFYDKKKGFLNCSSVRINGWMGLW